METHTPENRIYILPETGCTLDYRTGYDMGKAEQQAKIDELVKALEKYQATVRGLTGVDEYTATSLLMAYGRTEAALTRAKGE